MKVAFISMPYRSATTRGIIENIRKAEAVAIKYWLLGYAAICPQLNSALFDDILPDETWLTGYISILAKCDVCVMGQGWEKSRGATAEHEYAKAHGIDIIYD